MAVVEPQCGEHLVFALCQAQDAEGAGVVGGGEGFVSQPAPTGLLQTTIIGCNVFDVGGSQRCGHGTHEWMGASARLKIL